jgi:four helix bundle protein
LIHQPAEHLQKLTFDDSESTEATNEDIRVAIVRFARTLPTDPAILVIMRQLVKSGTSVGANYRSSCRAKSRADFVSKMTTAEEEADETLYRLEVLSDAGIVKASTVAALLDEADQLVRIFVASINTARGSRR